MLQKGGILDNKENTFSLILLRISHNKHERNCYFGLLKVT